MKVVHETFGLSTKRHTEFVDITSKVNSIVSKSGVTDGDVLVYCPHTTAAVTINENADPSVVHDILLILEELIPHRRAGYRHTEGNSDAHVKSSLVGCSEQVPVRQRSLSLGTWQGIFFCEFDGPRSRRVLVEVKGK